MSAPAPLHVNSPDAVDAAAAVRHALLRLAEAAAQQDYPRGALYVVATPIGNRADVSVRALHVLALADAIACEDTRHTRQWLGACGLERTVPLLALHQHNEAEAAQAIVERLRAGQRVACVSDAGTPGVSDPGARLVAAVQAAGLRALPLPGASSVTAALSVAGVADDGGAGHGFVFAGFVPSKGAERQRALAALAAEPRACVLLEAPHRILTLAQALAGALATPGALPDAASAADAPRAAAAPSRRVTVARELSKQFEQVHTLPVAELPAWLAADAQRQRGEFALVLHPAPHADTSDRVDAALPLLHRLLAENLAVKTAASVVAEWTGAPRKALYQAALDWKAQPRHSR